VLDTIFFTAQAHTMTVMCQPFPSYHHHPFLPHPYRRVSRYSFGSSSSFLHRFYFFGRAPPPFTQVDGLRPHWKQLQPRPSRTRTHSQGSRGLVYHPGASIASAHLRFAGDSAPQLSLRVKPPPRGNLPSDSHSGLTRRTPARHIPFGLHRPHTPVHRTDHPL
jgi:hypothetical protein